MEKYETFNKHIEFIKSFHGNSDKKIPDHFLMNSEGTLKQYYIPFDYVNHNAKLVLVGITPGYTQWFNAVVTARKELLSGGDALSALKKAKQHGAFSGSLRVNLIRLLDSIGINKVFNVSSSSAFFNSENDIIHNTSIFKNPILVNEMNYNGEPKNSVLLKNAMLSGFAEEIKSLKDPIYIPLGPFVTEKMKVLIDLGLIKENRVLSGLPHPSGANAERINYFIGEKRREDLSKKTSADKLDKSKKEIIDKINALVL